MRQVKSRALLVLLLAALVVIGLTVFALFYAADANSWALYPTNRHLYTDGILTRAGTVSDRDGVMLATTKEETRVFAEKRSVRKATLHAVGDLDGFISTGIQNAFRAQLCGYDPINGAFDPTDNGNDIRLTLSSEVCVAAQKALGSYAGTVAMYNYKTGEMIGMVSTPTYDPADAEETATAKEQKETGVFLNRFLSSTYTPGSTFKLVTAAAALETYGDAAYTMEFTCDHGTTLSGEFLSCLGDHGTLTLKEAFSHSCNSYFSQLAVKLGADTLTTYARKFGFNQSFSLDGIPAAASQFRLTGDLRDIELGWAGIGQYTDQMNPLQYLTAVGAIANNGVAVKPYLIRHITGIAGLTSGLHLGNSSRMLGAGTAQKLRELMQYAVKNNYGVRRFPGLSVCGKTGTAEVGKAVKPHAEFVGFCTDETLPMAFLVVVENAGSGSDMAIRVANATLQAAKKALG